MKHQLEGDTLSQAAAVFSQSAKSPSRRPSLRFTAARKWASLCQSDDSDETLIAYSIFIDLIP